jgi:3-hydroxyisobutyrate dehydrogenase-like beta-hydroxyacid dehydrogenase
MLMATIAFCGLGMMGSTMAQRLRNAGHTLRVWNRTAEKARSWAAGGGVACATPQEAARGASQAHLMVADDTAVDSIVFGSNGISSGLSRGAMIVDHSTVAPAGAKKRAQQLLGRWDFLQCPVFGSPPQIEEGKGLIIVGGDEGVYQKARTTLSEILPDHFRAGEKPEDAATFKLMGNSMLMQVVEALAEFFTIAKANGIDSQRAFSLLNVFNPCGTIQRRGPRMASGDYTPAFSLTMALKDVNLMLEASGPTSKLPALETIANKMKRLIAAGNANLDLAALGLDVIPTQRSS